MFKQCGWLNEPDVWGIMDDALTVTTNNATDFWRKTHYGFVRDNGHFFGCEAQGDFTATLRIRAAYTALYDQAGIMVRIDETAWIKAGIEFSDGEARLSSVLTVNESDWATGSYGGDPANFWMRVTLKQGVLRLQCSPDGRRWPLVRLCPFPMSKAISVGPMCCTPERGGLNVLFSNFDLTPAIERGLHDLS